MASPQFHDSANGDDGLVALGYVSETDGVLISGAAALLEVKNPYSASALGRQLVEVEYWLEATTEDFAMATDIRMVQ